MNTFRNRTHPVQKLQGTLACTQYPSTPFPASMSRILFGNFLLRDLWPSDLVGMVWGQFRKELRGARESPVARVHTCSNEWFIFGSHHVPFLAVPCHGDHSNAVTGSRCRWSGSANSNLKTCLVKSHNSSARSWLLTARLLLPDPKSKIQGLFHEPAKQLQQMQATNM